MAFAVSSAPPWQRCFCSNEHQKKNKMLPVTGVCFAAKDLWPYCVSRGTAMVDTLWRHESHYLTSLLADLNLCRCLSTHAHWQTLCFYVDPLLGGGWKQCHWAIFMAKLAMRMRHVTRRRGHPKPHICNQRPQFAYSLHITFMGLQRRLRGVYMEHSPIVKRFSAENFVPSKSGST